MKNTLFAKGIGVAIVILFVGTNLAPIVHSSISEKTVSTDSSTALLLKKSPIENRNSKPHPNGLVPQLKKSLISTTAGLPQSTSRGDRGYFYAFNAYDPNGMQNGPVTFDMDAVINLIAAHPEWNFISGSDFDSDGNWYAVYYYGGLFQVDSVTGDMTEIAAISPCDSIVLDTTTSIWYVSSSGSLYRIDITSGAMTLVGSFGTNGTMTSLMVDTSGNMYGTGVNSSGHSSLYSIDKTTGAATLLFNMGGLSLVTEGKFDRNDGTLYFCVYDLGMGQSYLAVCDPITGDVTIINMFNPIGIEIDGLAIPYTLPDHYLIPDFFWTPSDPLPGETVLFNASKSYDSGGNITLYEWDWNNDGVYEESHTTPTTTHSWNNPGNYLIWLRVTDDTGLTARKIKIVTVVNHPPEQPIIDGPTNGVVNHEYSFSINPITDPDGDAMYLKWDWGDGHATEWLGPYASGQMISALHAWTLSGVYEIRAKLKDTYGAESNWSDPHIITIFDNHPPETPDIQGTATGKPGVTYLYTFTTSDPETDDVFYYIDWGDNTNTSWLGPYPSGVQKSASHSWSQQGRYTVKIKAKDTWDAESDWGTLQVSMPLALTLDSYGLLTWLLTQLPHATLLFGMNDIPLGESLLVGITLSKIDSPQRIDPVPLGESRNFNFTINGAMRNGWYVSPVVITIDCGSNHTYYKLRAADPWTEYTSPITVSTDGIYELYFYYVDPNGGTHIFGPFVFKIDMTPPTITLTVTGKDHHWAFNVSCSDATSGVCKVEFYVDNASVGNVTAPGPYIFTYGGNGKVVQAAASDMAGNVGWSNVVQDLGLSVSSQLMLSPNGFLSVQQHILL